VAIARLLVVTLFVAVICQSTAFAQFGIQLTGVGPINRSMGGASTAAPLDTLGAFFWNPATITALPSSTDFSMELMLPQARLNSTVNAGSLAPGFPPVTLSGSDHSNSGVFPLPEFGVVYQPEDSPLSFGLGVLSVGGFSANYPGDPTNPILSPPPPFGLGVGPVYAQYMLMQIVPTVAIQATERLSVGISPIVDLAGLNLDPGVLAAPDAAGGGMPTFPPLTHGTYQWGGGVQAGAFYVAESKWQFGASIKSPQWFNSFQFNSKDQIGAPRNIKFVVDAPMIVSLGTAYTGIDRVLVALDVRYLDYHNTRPFSQVGFAPTGALKGVGWDSVFALSTGAQYLLSDAASVRVGYSYSTNPVSNDKTFFNIASPVIIQHSVYCGASYNITDTFKVSLAYSHFFANTISGPFLTPAGPIPGTNVTSRAFADSITAGASFLF
jgi:long-chain fatty acid transport protein